MKEDPNDKYNVKDEAIKGLTTDQMQNLLKFMSYSNDSGHNINLIQKRVNSINKEA